MWKKLKKLFRVNHRLILFSDLVVDLAGFPLLLRVNQWNIHLFGDISPFILWLSVGNNAI
jgi:hypothetical protein